MLLKHVHVVTAVQKWQIPGVAISVVCSGVITKLAAYDSLVATAGSLSKTAV